MSKKRGEVEQECLDLVKMFLFGRLDLSNISGHVCEVRDEALSHCFCGIDETDFKKICSVLSVATSNPDASVFPDFVSDFGFIEHFAVSASSENRKGSAYAQQTGQIEREIAAFRKSVEQQPKPFAIRVFSDMKRAPDASYEYLVASFCRICKHHIDSLRRISADGVRIFMIDMRGETLLSMCEKSPCFQDGSGIIENRWYGDVLRPLHRFHGYRLVFDKNLLEWVYQYRSDVDYVLFVGDFLERNTGGLCAEYGIGCDLISVNNIPALIVANPFGYETYSHVSFRTPYVACLTLPNTIMGDIGDNCCDEQ